MCDRYLIQICEKVSISLWILCVRILRSTTLLVGVVWMGSLDANYDYYGMEDLPSLLG